MSQSQRSEVILLGVLLVVGILIGGVSATLINLSQMYPDEAKNTFTNENVPINGEWDSSVNDSAIMWLTFMNMPTDENMNFQLTFNDMSTLDGSIVSQNTGLYTNDITVTLGSASNTTSYTHIPFIGVTPKYDLAYGEDPASGKVYLVLLTGDRTGASPYAKEMIWADPDVDSMVRAQPPQYSPIIDFIGNSSSPQTEIWGYTLSVDQLNHIQNDDFDPFGVLIISGEVGEGAVTLITMGLGFLVGEILPNLAILICVGEGLYFLMCLRNTSSIPAAMGKWIGFQVYLVDLFIRLIRWIIDILVQIKNSIPIIGQYL